MELNEQIIFLILFVVIGAGKWVIEKIRGGSNTPHETSESLEDLYEDFREEIRQRQTTVQQPSYSPPPIPQSPPPVQVQVQQVQPTQVTLPQPSERPKKVQLSSEEKAALANFQQLSSGQRRKRQGQQTSVRALLSSPQSARHAVILHEILGKPKAMQDA